MVSLKELLSSNHFFSDASVVPSASVTLNDLLKQQTSLFSTKQIQIRFSADNSVSRSSRTKTQAEDASERTYQTRALAAGILKDMDVSARFGLLAGIGHSISDIAEQLSNLQSRTDELSPPTYTSADDKRGVGAVPLDDDTIAYETGLAGVGINAGTFTLNGQTLTIESDDTIHDLVQTIEGSGTGVTAQVVGRKLELTSDNGIDIGSPSDTSNIAEVLQLESQSLKTANFAVAVGRAVKLADNSSTTDFGSLTINGQTIEVGAVTNSFGVFKAADTLASTINGASSITGVKASVSANAEIVLESVQPNTAIEISNTTKNQNTGLYAGNFEVPDKVTIRSQNNIVPDDYDFGDPSDAVNDLVQDFGTLANQFTDLNQLLEQLPDDRSSQAIATEVAAISLKELYLANQPDGEVTLNQNALGQDLYLSPEGLSEALADTSTALETPFVTDVNQLIRLPGLAEPAHEVSQHTAVQVELDQQHQFLQSYMGLLSTSEAQTKAQSEQLQSVFAFGKEEPVKPSQFDPSLTAKRKLNVTLLSQDA